MADNSSPESGEVRRGLNVRVSSFFRPPPASFFASKASLWAERPSKLAYP